MTFSYGFTFDDIPDLEGKVAIVTGGNSGIGFVIARELARKKAKVYIAARSQSKAETAIAAIKEATGTDENVSFLELDLESMKSATASARFFAKLESRLDILIANAGVAGIRSELSPDGYERIFAINHLGHFAFITALLPLLIQTADENPTSDVRVVLQSSRSYEMAKPLDLAKVSDVYTGTFGPFIGLDILARYARSKLCNLYFALELAELVKDIKNIYVNACHPGLIWTPIFSLADSPLPSYISVIAEWQAWLFGLPVNDGAKAALYCATDKHVIENDTKGKFYYPFGGAFRYFYLYERDITKLGADVDARKELWQFSEQALAKSLAS
ncbi:uncharacterized protein V1518DRAFT_411801 [Limtongia smithiae]|uniref:uncharacterized protein n=1 Tax=Limtongia smithiae TaxID=1125753 RepID=UPI0034CDDC94